MGCDQSIDVNLEVFCIAKDFGLAGTILWSQAPNMGKEDRVQPRGLQVCSCDLSIAAR